LEILVSDCGAGGSIQLCNATFSRCTYGYHDQGPGSGACDGWYKDYEAFAAKMQMTAASVALGKVRHLDIDSGYAYLVTPTPLTYTKAGKPITDKAIVTMSLKKGSSGWQITGWAWADQ
jgi:hypothetical protein